MIRREKNSCFSRYHWALNCQVPNPEKTSILQKNHRNFTSNGLTAWREKRRTEKKRKGKEEKNTHPPTHKDLDQIVWRSSDWNLWTKQRRKASDTEINLQKALQMWWDTILTLKKTQEQSRAEQRRETKTDQKSVPKTAEQQMQQHQRPKWCEEVSRVCTQFCALGGRQIWQRMLHLGSAGGYRCACSRPNARQPCPSPPSPS